MREVWSIGTFSLAKYGFYIEVDKEEDFMMHLFSVFWL